MQEAETAAALTCDRWSLGLVGKGVDERGTAATEFMLQKCDTILELEYHPENFILTCGDKQIPADDFPDYLSTIATGTLLLECSTLGIAEIFLCSRGAIGKLATMSFLYVEPNKYRAAQRQGLLSKRDFELSDTTEGFRAIPGAVYMLSETDPPRVIFFLGYEESRLDRAMEDFQMLNPSLCSVAFGVPAFQPGWEIDAFANNVKVMKDRGMRDGGVYFCGAENPLSAYRVLESIQSEMDAGQRMFIVPIGTKPNGIAAALYAAQYSQVGLLYDHLSRAE
jgi:hypothetical protein